MKLILFFAIRGVIAFVIGFLLASIMRTYFFNDLKKKSSKKREILISCLVGYILMLCIFMFMPNYLISRGGIDLSAQNFDFVEKNIRMTMKPLIISGKGIVFSYMYGMTDHDSF